MTPELEGLEPAPLAPEDTPHAGRSITDIQLKVRSCEGHTLCHLEYNSDILTSATIARMAANFRALIAAGAAHPDTLVDDLPALSEPEQGLLLREVQGLQREAYLDAPFMHQRFAALAARQPDAPAVIQPQRRSLSFAELAAAAAQLAGAIGAAGLPPGAPIGVHLHRSPEWVVAMLACLVRGGAAGGVRSTRSSRAEARRGAVR